GLNITAARERALRIERPPQHAGDDAVARTFSPDRVAEVAAGRVCGDELEVVAPAEAVGDVEPERALAAAGRPADDERPVRRECHVHGEDDVVVVDVGGTAAPGRAGPGGLEPPLRG